MNTAEVVVHEMQRNSCLVIQGFHGKSIRLATEAPRHAHCEVLTLDKGRAEVCRVRVAL